MARHGVREVHTLGPEMFKFLAHPSRGNRVIVAPHNLAEVAQTHKAVVGAASKGEAPPIRVPDDASLAVDEDVRAALRDYAYLEVSGGEQAGGGGGVVLEVRKRRHSEPQPVGGQRGATCRAGLPCGPCVIHEATPCTRSGPHDLRTRSSFRPSSARRPRPSSPCPTWHRSRWDPVAGVEHHLADATSRWGGLSRHSLKHE